MQGGVSQVDSFDYKPRLAKDDGKQMPFDDARSDANTGKRDSSQRVMKSLWKFAQHGQMRPLGVRAVPEHRPHVDDLCFLHCMHTEGVAHGPATLFLHTGSTNLVRPSMGSWVLYGLGTENENLPGFVTICPSMGNGGPRNYGNAFLPAVYQGTAIGKAGRARRSSRRSATCRTTSRRAPSKRRQLDLLQQLNAEQLKRHPATPSSKPSSTPTSSPGACRRTRPDVLDLSREIAGDAGPLRHRRQAHRQLRPRSA